MMVVVDIAMGIFFVKKGLKQMVVEVKETIRMLDVLILVEKETENLDVDNCVFCFDRSQFLFIP